MPAPLRRAQQLPGSALHPLDDARTCGAGGTGLGLATVRDIVTRRGGSVRIDGGQRGVRFSVDPPLAGQTGFRTFDFVGGKVPDMVSDERTWLRDGGAPSPTAGRTSVNDGSPTTHRSQKTPGQ